MNVLMVYPEFPDTFWSYKHALRFIRKHAHSPPLGLITVAAMLPPDRYDVRLRDLNVQALRAADLAWADCVFLSAMQVQQDSAREVIARCREAGVRIVAGGPLFLHDCDRFDEVDHLVINEAELTLPRFLDDLEHGRAQRVYRSEGYADLRGSPVPRFELLAMDRYAAMSIQYSRGCPFDCEFCDVTAMFGRRTRTKSAAQVIAELDRLRAAGWHERVFFVDDNLIANLAHARRELLPALEAWQRANGPVAFCSQVSINVADDPELIDAMARAGFDTVFIGIETPDTDALAACHKVQNVNRDLLADVRRIQAAGIQVQGGFIVGFDNESPSIFQRQIRFIETAGIVSAMVGILQAMTGTKLYQRLQREQRLIERASGNNVSDTTNFRTTMDARTLREGYAQVLRGLYAPEAYYRRLRTFLRHYGLPKVRPPLRWMDIRAFGRSVVMLGVVGRERLHYWRLLAWTLLHRPRLLGIAVHMSIIGQHYRRVCQAYFQGGAELEPAHGT